MKDQIDVIIMSLMLVAILLIAGIVIKLSMNNHKLQSEVIELEEERDTMREFVQKRARDFHGTLAIYRDEITGEFLFINEDGRPCRAYGRE
ncbi:MAG TPA: hypothetical protein ENH85_00360 [Candidatus Scalindua sp.]|nr:hypothetical protein [Candidatus Scalindua sp.]